MTGKLPLIFCALAALLTGCASVQPTRFYTLSPATVPAATPPAVYSLSVGPVWVPAAVDRPQIVVQTGPNQVLIAEFDRWAAPLREDIPRIVAENLAAILGTQRVTVFPQSAAADASYRIALDILRFDALPGKGVVLDARWTVSGKKDGTSENDRAKFTEDVQGNGYAELVAAHSRALGQLSGRIARTIRDMDGRKP